MGLEIMYEEGGDFLHEADEWLPATLTALEADEGQYGPSIKWIFVLDEDTQDAGPGMGSLGKETWAWSDQKITTKNKTGRWATAIEPSLTVGKVVDLGKLVDRRVDVMFERTTKADGTEGEKVVKVRASKTPAPDPQVESQPFVATSAVTGEAAASADDLF